MADLVPLAGTDAVRTRLPAGNKRALFARLAAIGEALTGIGRADVLRALQDREREGTTGLGGGVAVPHGRLEGLSGVTGFFTRLSSPVAYDALDDQPVDLVFTLLSPPEAGVDHLKALAAVSRALRDRGTLDKLRGARTRDAMFALLHGDTPGNGA